MAKAVQAGEARPAPTMPAVLIGIKDVARMLSVSVRTVERFMAANRFPTPDVRIGARILWKPETITNWVDTESTRQRSEPGHSVPPAPAGLNMDAPAGETRAKGKTVLADSGDSEPKGRVVLKSKAAKAR